MDWHSPSQHDRTQFDPAEVFAAGLALHHIANTAYPIGHITTMRPYKVPRSMVQATAPRAWGEIDRLGLYVHVPFCEARCGFCEYTVLDPQTITTSEDLYFDLLLGEFDLWSQAIDTQSKTLIGFDIGGGTPSVPEIRNIARVMEAARLHFLLPADVVISIETTPKIAARQLGKLRAYHGMGIRRISMGVQTVNARLLQDVNRTSTSLKFNQAAVENIRAAGFTRFNVDVMYGFARQSLASVEATLEHVINLGPEFVTLYRMRYKGTRLSAQVGQVNLRDVTAQARRAKELLLAAGYHGAPGKNTFSRLEGDAGTSDYLTERVIHGTPYLGLGLGAQSLSHKSLSYNSGAADKRLSHYQRQIEAGALPIQDLYHLSREAAMGKMLSVSFYFGEINLASFSRKFGVSLEQAFPDEVDFLLQHGLMEYCDKEEGKRVKEKNLGGRNVMEVANAARTLRLTANGEDHVNGVIALFYAGAVKDYLLKMSKEGRPEVERPVGGGSKGAGSYPVLRIS